MSDIVRTGRIVINLETGKVELKAPDLGPLLESQKQAIAQQKEITQAVTATSQAQQAAVAEAVTAQAKTAEASRASAQVQQEAAFAVSKNTVEALRGVTQLGEGFFLLARSAALFSGSADKELKQLVQTVATVQAGFDLFKGTAQTLQGVVQILEKLAAARKAQAAASAAVAVAETGAAAATTGAAAAAGTLTVALGPISLIVTGIAAAVGIAAATWKLLADREKDAAEEAKKYAEAEKARADAYAERGLKELEIGERLRELRRQALTDEEKAAEATARGSALASKQYLLGKDRGFTDEEGQNRQQIAIQEQLIQANRQRKEAEEAIATSKQRALEIEIRSVQEQEKAVDAARRALDIEKQKVQSFEAQFGQLSRIEQERLKSISKKVEAGQGLSRFEENELRRIGGDAGRSVADQISGRRGRSDGADDVLRRLGGLGGVNAAQQAAAAEQSKLDTLTGGVDAKDFVKKLEAQNKQTLATAEDFGKKLDSVLLKLVGKLEELETKQLQLVEAAKRGR